MPKILSQSGDSLADIYDVAGSVAGIDQLETHELPIVHEMGATVFSERLATQITRVTSAATAQNTDINLVITTLPVVHSRLLGLQIVSDDATRILRVVVLARNPTDGGGQEIPIWTFDPAAGGEAIVMDDQGTLAALFVLIPNIATTVPTLIGGSGQLDAGQVDEVAIRARTTGFGAGTVFLRALLHVAFPRPRGVADASRGLPVPSW